MDVLRRELSSLSLRKRGEGRGEGPNWLELTVLFALTSCATVQLTPSDAKSLSERTWEGAPDEVFDASWLTLASKGYDITASDRVAGTMVIKNASDTWDLDVAAQGTEQRVVLAPRQVTTRAHFSALLDELFTGTRTFLRAWHDLPEWKYDGRHNQLRVPGFSVAPPPEWEWLNYDISRRFVVVQRRRARTGLNPTLLVELDRRRPDSQLRAGLQRGAGLALAAGSRLLLPEELHATEDQTGQHGALQVLDGTTPQDLVWHAYQTVLGPADVRLIMVCPKSSQGECRALWRAVFQSVSRSQ